MNGYLDEDGCPDSLARMKIVVLDGQKQPLQGASILFPGLNEAIETDANGIAILLELLPVPSFSVDVTSPDQSQKQTINVRLNEGANEITVETDW